MEADYPVVQLSERGSNALYKVDFIGRMTAHRGVYNHLQFGNYEQEVFAGRMIALQELQPPQNSNDDGPLK